MPPQNRSLDPREHYALHGHSSSDTSVQNRGQQNPVSKSQHKTQRKKINKASKSDTQDRRSSTTSSHVSAVITPTDKANGNVVVIDEAVLSKADAIISNAAKVIANATNSYLSSTSEVKEHTHAIQDHHQSHPANGFPVTGASTAPESVRTRPNTPFVSGRNEGQGPRKHRPGSTTPFGSNINHALQPVRFQNPFPVGGPPTPTGCAATLLDAIPAHQRVEIKQKLETVCAQQNKRIKNIGHQRFELCERFATLRKGEVACEQEILHHQQEFIRFFSYSMIEEDAERKLAAQKMALQHGRRANEQQYKERSYRDELEQVRMDLCLLDKEELQFYTDTHHGLVAEIVKLLGTK
ncbi:uncharacterized protein BDR25DRAFT_311303 [Lindgomyces ingoldianus]|uniref:Uncharacterized protein n=1 Tax=Lindgomyces ingoldianus TaxID=673940 RepID=A0ACB6R9A0_9PLEO|nr:uncharacterized protein BDR25DRAFT_311303 [Lindgomyces ingoldianus]KAF2474905.1 hypothetical protein BDR25DRAFT_311303 [Lindgomyces ingoldianus]